MKRIIVTLLIFLLLGAIVNIAVACWRGALLPSIRGLGADAIPANERDGLCNHFGIATERRNRFKAWRQVDWAVTHIFGSTGYLADASGSLAGWSGSSTTQYVSIVEAGWPCRCLIKHSGDWMITRLVAGMPEPFPAAQCWTFLRNAQVSWPSFAINTLFYAVILWLLFASRLVLPRYRRMRRIKRGLCPACGYPVGTSDLCTECGKTVTKRYGPTGQVGTT